MKNRRIAITGLGIVSPLGNDVKTTWDNLLAQRSGIALINNFDASGFPTRIAAEVKNFDARTYVKDRKILRQSVPYVQFALAASEQALADSGIKPTATTQARWGCVVGAGMMSTEHHYLENFQKRFAIEGNVDYSQLNQNNRDFIKLSEFARSCANVGVGLLAKQYQIGGYINSVHTACASGGQALGLALQVMRRGDSDYMLVGGFDSMINPIGLSSFCLLGAVATDNDTPASASRPFDLTRHGFVLGEGAAFMVLEDFEKAHARGAKIYAELAGEGNSLSSYRITDSHPSGDGAIQAIQGALNDAGVSIHEIDYINAHGTSTKMNDLSETNAIKAVFENRAKQIPVSSTKSQTGHLIAAAGALEGVISVLAIEHSMIPMTMNLTTPDPECNLDYVADKPRAKNIKAVLSNSFGFGGSNSCIVFKHPEFVGGAA